MEHTLNSLDQWCSDFLNLSHYDAVSHLPFTHITTPIVGTLVFGLMIICGRFFSVSKETLKSVSLVHNLILSVGSAIMVSGAILSLWQDPGICVVGFFCRPAGWTFTFAEQMWLYVFYVSKFYEYFDTLILVLKGKPVGFLQGYHHTVVPYMAWVFLRSNCLLSMHSILVNGSVHTLMYYYFFQVTRGKRVWWKKYVTLIQITQFITSFVCGAILCYFVYQLGSQQCSGLPTFWFASVFNFSFLLLFVQLFLANSRKEKVAKKAN